MSPESARTERFQNPTVFNPRTRYARQEKDIHETDTTYFVPHSPYFYYLLRLCSRRVNVNPKYFSDIPTFRAKVYRTRTVCSTIGQRCTDLIQK